MITPLNQDDLNTFTLEMLVRRMDSILLLSNQERYGSVDPAFGISLVSSIVNTKQVMALSDDKKRKVAHLAFAYLVQLELNSVLKWLCRNSCIIYI